MKERLVIIVSSARNAALGAATVLFLLAQILAGAHAPDNAHFSNHLEENCAACFAAGGAPDPAGASVAYAGPAANFAPVQFQSAQARAVASLVLSPQSRGPPEAFIKTA